jgi:hypothetical protein
MIDTLPIDLIDRVVALIMAIGCSRPVAAAAGHVPAVPGVKDAHTLERLVTRRQPPRREYGIKD